MLLDFDSIKPSNTWKLFGNIHKWIFNIIYWANFALLILAPFVVIGYNIWFTTSDTRLSFGDFMSFWLLGWVGQLIYHILGYLHQVFLKSIFVWLKSHENNIGLYV